MQLRCYQQKIINEVRHHMMKGQRAILIEAPVGSGKTVLTAHMLKTATEKGLHSWFNVPRIELLDQSIDAFSKMQVPHGVIAAQYMPDTRKLCQLASISTLINRHSKYRTPKLIVWDECHHIAAKSWARIFNAYPEAFHIGLSGSPIRLDGQGLGEFFKVMVSGPSMKSLINEGYLSPYRIYAPATINTTGVHTRMGDFVRSELSHIVDRPSITGSAISEYKKLASGRRAIVFCVSVKHSQHVAWEFREAGIDAVHVDGATNKTVRKQAIKDFRKGNIKILCGVDLFGEGLDIPGVECAILLRPTQSLGLYIQQVGRALRICEGKTEAIILDHAGNCMRHGMPDEDREWKLTMTRAKRGRGALDKSVKICEQCFTAQYSGKTHCVNCGQKFEIQYRKVDEREGELAEITKLNKIKRKNEQVSAKTLEGLIELAKKRGYKKPYWWAKMIHNARLKKKAMG